MKKYNTVKTTKMVDGEENHRARRLIDACPCTAYTRETERDIDLALGIGTATRPEVALIPMDERTEFVDILDDAGPDEAAFEAMAVADAAAKVAES